MCEVNTALKQPNSEVLKTLLDRYSRLSVLDDQRRSSMQITVSDVMLCAHTEPGSRQQRFTVNLFYYWFPGWLHQKTKRKRVTASQRVISSRLAGHSIDICSWFGVFACVCQLLDFGKNRLFST